jgi:hypothetical protein
MNIQREYVYEDLNDSKRQFYRPRIPHACLCTMQETLYTHTHIDETE